MFNGQLKYKGPLPFPVQIGFEGPEVIECQVLSNVV